MNCHPRTILRAITRKENPGFERQDPDVRIADVATVFSVDHATLARVLNSDEPMLNQKEAAAYMGMEHRTFCRRLSYRPFLRNSFGVIRYLPSMLDTYKETEAARTVAGTERGEGWGKQSRG